jgi:hypothetical protein
MLATQDNRISHPSSHTRPESSSPEKGKEEEEESVVIDPTQRSITQHRSRNSHQMQQQAKQGRDSFQLFHQILSNPQQEKAQLCCIK